MRAARIALLLGAQALLPACADPPGEAPGPSSAGAVTPELPEEIASAARETPALETPNLKPKALTSNQRRVVIFVTPGSALVEVEGKPTPRRDGVIEIVGDVGREYQVRTISGTNVRTKNVTITSAPQKEPPIDANEKDSGARRPKFFGTVND